MHSPTLSLELATKAAKDPAFRDALRRDVRGTIENYCQVPAGILRDKDIKFLEHGDGSCEIIFPEADPLAEGAELSEAELEGISGGAMMAKNFNSPFLTDY